MHFTFCTKFSLLTVAAVLLSLCLAASAPLVLADDSNASSGPLDEPLPGSDAADSAPEAAPEEQQEQLQEEVRDEQEELEQLPRDELEEGAEAGERASQVALGVDYAKEAQQLTFAPVAANAAASDAIRWYSIAAQRGFPGAPSLDLAGVRFYPVRVQRSTQ